VNHTAGAELFAKGFAVRQHHVTRVVLVFRFLLGVEMIEIAEEFVEAVVGGQVRIPITKMVLAEIDIFSLCLL